MHDTSRIPLLRLGLAVFVTLVTFVGTSQAYDAWSQGNDTGNCATCHGDFRGNPYTSDSDGQTWSSSLHNVHRFDILNSDCNTCHGVSNFPVLIGESVGGTGLAAYGCAGCHGRAEDGTNPPTTEGFGAGLRQHHWNRDAAHPTLDLRVCLDCHADSDPAAYTPVGENVIPPYYSTMDTAHPAMPSDPCSPAAAGFPENFEGTTVGLDNDGDTAYDEADSNCGAALPGPGETAAGGALPEDFLLVTSRDSVGGQLTVQYVPACGTTDHTFEFGQLDQLSSYAYGGQVCSLGGGEGDPATAFDWSYDPGSCFFLVVGNNGTIEGSYGLDSNGAERPEDTVNVICPLDQDLADRCD